MEYLDESTARHAVVRALGKQFIVPPVGDRVAVDRIEYSLIRRSEVLSDALVYRVRLIDGVMMGGFVGEGAAV